jgi:uncharacterized cupin superfamily protein
MPRERRRLGDAFGLTKIGIDHSEGHQLLNRSTQPAVYLVVSNRDAEDTVNYTDADVDLMASPPHARG